MLKFLNYDLRSFMSFPFNPETDIPLTIALGQIWTYALTVFYPTQALKSMGLYPKNEIGQYPPIVPFKGEGQSYCQRYRKPCYLDKKPEDYNRVEDFDRISAIYETCMKPFSQPIFEETVKLMQPFLVPTARILDLSCGPGIELPQLAALVPYGEVVAMDLSIGMVATAFERAKQQGIRNTAFFQADAAKMPEHFAGHFDAIYCSLAFHHYPDPLAAVKEMHRVLNETGKAFVADPGPWWFNLISGPLARWADPGWVGFHTGEEFHFLFSKAGFSHFYWNEILPGIGVCIGTK
jgi:ubiquinone/menaquinone biosynthesis C-methylase UbiE